jgi:integrase
LGRLLVALDAEPDPFIRCIFRLILATGCRKSEALRARPEDFDLTEGRIPTFVGSSSTVAEAVKLGSVAARPKRRLALDTGSRIFRTGDAFNLLDRTRFDST